MKKGVVLTIIASIVVLLAVAALALAWYPTLAMRQPAYKNAKAVCDSITIGMTYEDVKNKVGNLFFPEPMTYVDSRGNGQAQLRNDVKGLDTTCIVTFRNGKVITAGMAYGWL
jgi:hypothetical protein